MAVLVTFITNPFTLPFWLYAANRIGHALLEIDEVAGGAARSEMESGRWGEVMWWVNGVGVTAFGFVVLAVVSAGGRISCRQGGLAADRRPAPHPSPASHDRAARRQAEG